MPRSRPFNPQALGRQFAGWLLVVGGSILTPLPIPVGLLLLGLGLALLARDSRWIRRRLRGLLGRSPGLAERLRRLEPHCSDGTASLLRKILPKRRMNDGKEIRDP